MSSFCVFQPREYVYTQDRTGWSEGDAGWEAVLRRRIPVRSPSRIEEATLGFRRWTPELAIEPDEATFHYRCHLRDILSHQNQNCIGFI